MAGHAGSLAPRAPRFSLVRFVDALAYLGGMFVLVLETFGALFSRRSSGHKLVSSVLRHMDWMLGMGLPLVALVHVPFGSFLAMQAFFQATFTEAAGPVVGLGLLRNVAPLMTGMVLASLLAVRITVELRVRSHLGVDGDPAELPDRETMRGSVTDSRVPPSPGRLTLVRVLAAAFSGPLLALTATIVGTAIGCVVAMSMLGLAPAIYFSRMFEMMQPIDIVGLVVKSSAFAASSSLFACHEGLRVQGPRGGLRWAVYRAICWSILSILILNYTWFNLAFLAGRPFGPLVVAAPAS